MITFCLEMKAKTTSKIFHFVSDDHLNKRAIARWNFFPDNLNFSTSLRIANQVGFHLDGVFMALNYDLLSNKEVNYRKLKSIDLQKLIDDISDSPHCN